MCCIILFLVKPGKPQFAHCISYMNGQPELEVFAYVSLVYALYVRYRSIITSSLHTCPRVVP